MTRVLILGNSHVGALRDAWTERGGKEPGLEVRFFAAPTHIFDQMRLEPNLVFSLPDGHPRHAEFAEMLARINAVPAVDLSTADHVLHVGSNCAFGRIGGLLSEFEVDGYRADGMTARLSSAAFDAMAAEIARFSLPPAVWRGWTQPALTLMPRPVVSEDCLAKPAKAGVAPWIRAAKTQYELKPLLGRYFGLLDTELDRHRITLLRQPAETLAATGLTAAGYATGSRSMPNGNGRFSDHTHMNAAFGALCLDRLFARIRGTEPPVAATPEPQPATATH